MEDWMHDETIFEDEEDFGQFAEEDEINEDN
mgnify:CR=1 FL=1